MTFSCLQIKFCNIRHFLEIGAVFLVCRITETWVQSDSLMCVTVQGIQIHRQNVISVHCLNFNVCILFWTFASFEHVSVSQQEGQGGPVTLIWLPDTFRVNWHFRSRGEVQYRFLRRSLLGFQSERFDATSILSMTFPFNCPFGSGGKFQNCC